MSRETIRDGALVLADGSVFEGELIGAEAPIATGEVVFNTVMTGYQEVITDPSYAGQIITFTTAHLGNYGVNPTDDESRGTFCRGIVIRELSRRHSNHRATGGLDAMLATSGVPASEVSRILMVSGTSPRNGTPMRSASLRAPPWPKIS